MFAHMPEIVPSHTHLAKWARTAYTLAHNGNNQPNGYCWFELYSHAPDKSVCDECIAFNISLRCLVVYIAHHHPRAASTGPTAQSAANSNLIISKRHLHMNSYIMKP